MCKRYLKKNSVYCTIGATDCICTVGFIKTSRSEKGKAFPRTLMKGNELKNVNFVELLLRKKKGKEKFDEMIIGNKETIISHFSYLKDIVEYSLIRNEKIDNQSYKVNIKSNIKQKGIPVCFRTDTYSEKLKKAKLQNRLR